MKIIFEPYGSRDNMYTGILIEGLRKRDFDVIPMSSPSSDYKSVKIVHLNWFENVASFLNFLNKTRSVVQHKVLGKKIVWTLHNKIPHENLQPSLQRTFMKILMSLSDKIIIHSLDSEKIFENSSKKTLDKIQYLPHPGYIDIYGVDSDISLTKVNEMPLNLLFVGLVRPYKNLELLIDCVGEFGDKVRLVIAGRPLNEEYRELITQQARIRKNIELDLTFIENSRLVEYIQQSDLVVLPYKLDSVLNSGTVILSFSYARSVICPNIGTINDVLDKSSMLNYGYSTESEHRQNLIDSIERAVCLKQESPETLQQWGLDMKQYVAAKHDIDLVVDQLANIYRDLVE